MDYSEVVARYFAPRPDGTPVPDAVRLGSPARRLRDAVEPIAMHAAWSRRTIDGLARLGLDASASYVAGRASSLGEPSGLVVAATFAWFEPSLISSLYESSRAIVPREQLIVARDEATTGSLWEILGNDDPTEFADLVAEAVTNASGAGRSLFSGLRGRGRPADPAQRLWWACDLVREHRGDSHVAAASASAVGPVEMNVLTELWLGMPLLSYTDTRGWSAAEMAATVASLEARGWLTDGQLTWDGRSARVEIEARTDQQEQSIVDALGDRLEDVCAQLNIWSARCVLAGAFPPDVLKRAAG